MFIYLKIISIEILYLYLISLFTCEYLIKKLKLEKTWTWNKFNLAVTLKCYLNILKGIILMIHIFKIKF